MGDLRLVNPTWEGLEGSFNSLVSVILQHEFRILVLEQVIDVLMTRIPIVGPAIQPSEMERIRKRALERLKVKYPAARIELESL